MPSETKPNLIVSPTAGLKDGEALSLVPLLPKREIEITKMENLMLLREPIFNPPAILQGPPAWLSTARTKTQ